ncbi:preprotein translocase subunit SecA [soil metagenome]
MFSFFKNILDFNSREVARLQKRVEQINQLEDSLKKLSPEDFPRETEKLKKEIQSGVSTVEDVLPRAYALVREAAHRALNQRHYDVQLLASIALHEGKIVEQKTGEGKTLTATAALYLNALEGKGVHLVTVNDYLARRDAGWMGAVFSYLGLTTSAIISGTSLLYDPNHKEASTNDPRLMHLKQISRKEAYAADVTYGINSEFGFDYLRDNMAGSSEQLVQRGFNFAIVDEADSVLIDEARTPHIISAPYDEETSKYYDYAKIVRNLSAEQDYIIDEKLRTAHLTENGIEKIEKNLGVDNIYEKDFDTLFHIEAALKANTLFQKDNNYIVRGNEVVIVDEFTGRLLEGRRFSEGLHQAIEAKEGVSIKQESRTLATVSLQNYFRGYKKLAGMTGTAATEAEEFSKIYSADVLIIPTHRTNIRRDHPDMIYKTEKAKFNAVVEDIVEQYKKGRPVLVGTTSIAKNEYLSSLLLKRGVKHELLNAKNHEQEAHIIAQAGKKNAVTVATNMAGRGVDIVLGGEVNRDDFKTEEQYKKAQSEWKKEHEEVLEVGGLYVLGTERHESRRIDNQLRGRAGRQGDSGETRFFVSLEDDVMRIFGGEQISNLMTMLKFPEDQPLSHSMVSRAIEQAQVKVEGFNFDMRKNLVEYDDVLNRQRDIIYSLRKKILLFPETDPTQFRETVFNTIHEQIAVMSVSYFALQESMPELQQQFMQDVELLFNTKTEELEEFIESNDQIGFEEYIKKQAAEKYENREKHSGVDIWNQVVRSVYLSTIDQFWTQHLTAIDDLREGINLRGYAQLDPLIEYKNEAFRMFEKLLTDTNYESIRRVMRVEIEHPDENPNHIHIHDHETPKKVEPPKKEQKQLNYKAAAAVNPFNEEKKDSLADKSVSQLAIDNRPQIGRNDPCPCGSGKKWKKCHYPNIP